jgi:hypothetical protein
MPICGSVFARVVRSRCRVLPHRARLQVRWFIPPTTATTHTRHGGLKPAPQGEAAPLRWFILLWGGLQPANDANALFAGKPASTVVHRGHPRRTGFSPPTTATTQRAMAG